MRSLPARVAIGIGVVLTCAATAFSGGAPQTPRQPARPSHVNSASGSPIPATLATASVPNDADDPNLHQRLVVVTTAADATDGIETTSAPLPGFPDGLLLMMNSGARNFLVFPWEAVQTRIPGAR